MRLFISMGLVYVNIYYIDVEYKVIEYWKQLSVLHFLPNLL